MPVPDLFLQGIERGWQVIDASALAQETTLEADVVIIGTGAGGGTSAEILANAGLRVLLVEEGSLKTSSDFKNDEAKAYAELYQEGAARATADAGIGILQGRTVGGTTTVNWTSSFRTPDQTLAHWAEAHDVKGLDNASMAPWFARMEERLGIALGSATECQQRCDSPGLRETRLPLESDSAQRARLLEPWLLWHRLPNQCQAVDAGHDPARSAGEGRGAGTQRPCRAPGLRG